MSEQDESTYENDLKEFFDNSVNVADWWKGRDLDWVLQDIVQSVDEGDGKYEPRISISTAAGVISGTVISRQDFLNELAAQMYPESTDVQVQKNKKDWLEHSRPKPGAELHPPQFIHLRGAQVFTGGVSRIPSNTGVLWRGKLSAVIGFTYSGLD